ncbi:MAG TPA: hypothetical protein VNO55_14360 [Polyangia bacterium]|nr:hypothetical protein [Polyangia bacterium]
MAVAVGLTWGQAGAWAGQPRSPTESQPASGQQSDQTPASDGQHPLAAQSVEDGYAAREAQAKNLENFKGGDVVIITTTTVLIILVVVLILIII